MRVGQLMAHVSRRSAGVWSVVEAMSNALTRSDGVEATVFGVDAADTPDLLTRHMGAPVVSRPVVGPQSLGYAPGLATALTDARLDVLHAHGLWMYPSRLGRDWARHTGRPHLVSPHGMLDPWALAHNHWKKRLVAAWFEQAHLREATCLHALCASELEAIRDYGLDNPVCVIPNGVDLPDGPVPVSPPWYGKVAEDRRVLLYLGRIHPKKGLRFLLEGLAAAPQTAAWTLVIAGWDQDGHEAELKALAAALGIEDTLLFVGPLQGDAKAAAFVHADAFVLPSLSEGLPMTVLEAWSHGLPVLMTPPCHLPEGVERAAAIEVDATAEGLACGLGQLFEMSVEERAAMGCRGLALVKQRYTWPQVASRMQGVYEWLLGGGVAPADVDSV